jgi:hypothetical protein
MAPAVDSRKNGDLQPYNLRALSSNRQILWQPSSLYSPWLWVPTADSFCLSVSHHVPDTLWNRSKACEAWTRSGVRFLPTPPGSQSSLIFCFFFVENSEGSLRTPLSCDFTIQNGVTSEASSSIGSPYHIFSLCGISSAYLRRQRSAEKLFECPTVFIRLYSNGQMTL